MQRSFALARRTSAQLLAVAALALGTGSAHAALIGVQLADHPDIFSGFIDTSYVAGSDTLVADGDAITLDDDGVGSPENIQGGSGGFDLDAVIDGSGNFISGTLTISGEVPSLGFNSGTLLTGTLTALGADDGTGLMDFLFTVTGGDAASLFGGNGTTAGGVLSNTGFSGNWNTDFNSSNGESDVAALVPVPPAFLLFGSGLLALVLGGRRGS